MKLIEEARWVRLMTTLLGMSLVIAIAALGVGVLLERWSLVVKAVIGLLLLLVVVHGWIGLVKEGALFLSEEEQQEREEIEELDN